MPIPFFIFIISQNRPSTVITSPAAGLAGRAVPGIIEKKRRCGAEKEKRMNKEIRKIAENEDIDELIFRDEVYYVSER